MLKKILSLPALAFAAFISVYPVLYILGVALRPDNAFSLRTLSILPEGATGANFVSLLRDTDFLLWLRNSTVVSVAVVVTGVSLAALSGYSLSRFEFRGRRAAQSAGLNRCGEGVLSG